MRYSHNASGQIRGILPLKDACCSNVFRDGRCSVFFSVPSAMSQPLHCSNVNREATALGDPEFQFKDDCKLVIFPSGPTTLLANQVVGDSKASGVDCEAAYWTFEMSKNR